MHTILHDLDNAEKTGRQAFGPPKILKFISFACRWQLRAPVANDRFFLLKPTLYPW